MRVASIPVIYDSKKVIPAPFITISRDVIQQEDGTRLGGIYNISVRGKLTATKGSPNSSGVFWTSSDYPPDEDIPANSRLTAIMSKQKYLRDLFNVDGKLFEVSGFDSFTPFKCNPRIKKIEFPDGEGKGANWTEYSEYVISMEADCVHGVTGDDCPADNALITKFSEEWNIELLDENKKTYRLTRSLSATGRRMFAEDGTLKNGKQAWENARDYLTTTIGLGIKAARMASVGVVGGSLQAFNYVRSEHIGETGGISSIAESWVCFDPEGDAPATNEQTITVRTNIQDGLISVGVEGVVQGLEKRDNTTHALISTRFANATTKWTSSIFPNVYANAQAGLVGLSTATLNVVPTQSSIGKNELAGTLSYSYEFNNRATPLISGALSEIISINNSYPADVFAQIPIPGRPIGPILQPTGTVTVRKRSISIEIQMPGASTTTPLAAPSTGAIILALIPTGTSALFVDQDEESWTPTSGRYSRNTSFTFE